MTLQDTSNFFEHLKTQTTKNSESKVYEKFIHILKALQNREISEAEIYSIEKELDNLNLKSNPGNRKKFFKKALNQFERFLKDEFFLTTKGYYTNTSISFGVLFGVVVGVLIGQYTEKSMGLSLGICMGMFVGIFIGRRKDAQVKAAGNVL